MRFSSRPWRKIGIAEHDIREAIDGHWVASDANDFEASASRTARISMKGHHV
jgi:hypothetical protein